MSTSFLTAFIAAGLISRWRNRKRGPVPVPPSPEPYSEAPDTDLPLARKTRGDRVHLLKGPGDVSTWCGLRLHTVAHFRSGYFYESCGPEGPLAVCADCRTKHDAMRNGGSGPCLACGSLAYGPCPAHDGHR